MIIMIFMTTMLIMIITYYNPQTYVSVLVYALCSGADISTVQKLLL